VLPYSPSLGVMYFTTHQALEQNEKRNSKGTTPSVAFVKTIVCTDSMHSFAYTSCHRRDYGGALESAVAGDGVRLLWLEVNLGLESIWQPLTNVNKRSLKQISIQIF
jgi:hypothetical protein